MFSEQLIRLLFLAAADLHRRVQPALSPRYSLCLVLFFDC